MATLLIMRHAEAEASRPGQPDHLRQLTPAGHARAAAQSAVVAAHAPDLVLCSAAERATQTLAHLDVSRAAVQVDQALYGASATEVLLRLAELAPEIGTVLLVGHMPTVAEVASALLADHGSGEPGADDADRLRTRGLEPGAVAVLDVPGPWSDLQPATGRLRHLG